MASEIERARAALAAGNVDEALVLLWHAVEPARLADDREALLKIAALAQSIPRREAEDLVHATGVEPTERAAKERSATRAKPTARQLVGALWLLVVGSLALFSVLRGNQNEEAEAPRPPVRLTVPIVVEAPGLYLVPLARYPSDELNRLVLDLVPQAGAVDVVPPLGLGPTAFDAARSQFVAEALLQRVTEDWRILPGLRALFVGVTSFDMYARGHPEPYATVVRSSDGRYVVVSTHRLSRDADVRKAQLHEILVAEVRRAALNP